MTGVFAVAQSMGATHPMAPATVSPVMSGLGLTAAGAAALRSTIRKSDTPDDGPLEQWIWRRLDYERISPIVSHNHNRPLPLQICRLHRSFKSLHQIIHNNFIRSTPGSLVHGGAIYGWFSV